MKMGTGIRLLRKLVREELDLKRVNQPYINSLIDDEAYQEDSVYVPNDIKDTIKLWMKSMKLESKL